MAERGIDISNEFPKPWTDETVRAADVVITMSCGDACPSSPANATNPGTTSTTPRVSRPLTFAPYTTTSNAASDN
jgi:protein-tyrosine-phosphatase